jgi:hypothetical protein
MPSTSFPKRFLVHAHNRLFKAELEDVQAYARLTTALMLAEAQKHEAYVDKTASALSEDEREAYFDNNSDTYDLLVRRFPNQQQQSLVVLTYTVVETRLVAVARALLKDGKTGLALKDLAGDSPFQKSRKVITRVAGFDVDQKLWDEVEAYRLIRNAIVHNAGDLGQELHQLVKQLLMQHPTKVQNSESDGLVIQPAFLLAFADAAEALLEAVFNRWLEAETKSAA